MNPWPFIVTSYVVTIGTTVGVTIWSWAAMRRAEAEASRLSERP